jgi:hypothetical protein
VSVSSVGGAAAAWFNAGTSVTPTTATSSPKAVGHQFVPNDPLNQFLTDADRSAIKSSTGVDFRADGGILSPMAMSAIDYGAVLNAVGQLAADRANGSSSPLTSSSVAELLGSFGFQGTGIDGGKADLRVDFLA